MFRVKGATSAGKFPEKSFSGLLKAIYPSTKGKKDSGCVTLDIDEETQLFLFGLDQMNPQTKKVPGFTQLGKFLDSLTALRIEYTWLFMNESDPLPTGIELAPDITGKIIHIEMTETPKEIGVGTEPGTWKDWILTKWETPTIPTPPTTSASAPAAPTPKSTKQPGKVDMAVWTEFFTDHQLPEPTTAAGIVKFIDAVDIEQSLREYLKQTRKDALPQLVVAGVLKLDGMKYLVVV